MEERLLPFLAFTLIERAAIAKINNKLHRQLSAASALGMEFAKGKPGHLAGEVVRVTGRAFAREIEADRPVAHGAVLLLVYASRS